jgi:hypothetical protein
LDLNNNENLSDNIKNKFGQAEMIRFGLIQLDYSLVRNDSADALSYVLSNTGKEEMTKYKAKILEALNKAEENKVDVVCFPELSFDKKLVSEIIGKFKNMIIIAGSHYEDGYNVCNVIVCGQLIEPSYKKCYASLSESDFSTQRGMKLGEFAYIFRLGMMRFSVLTCIDYQRLIQRICEYHEKGSKPINFIINLCCDENLKRYLEKISGDCDIYNICVIQVNKATQDEKYGGSGVSAKEHRDIVEKFKYEGYKKSSTNYELFQIYDKESMIIFDLDVVRGPEISAGVTYNGRLILTKKNIFEYNKDSWEQIQK